MDKESPTGKKDMSECLELVWMRCVGTGQAQERWADHLPHIQIMSSLLMRKAIAFMSVRNCSSYIAPTSCPCNNVDIVFKRNYKSKFYFKSLDFQMNSKP